MTDKEFAAIRTKLDLTQRQMAGLLGKSLRAVQSFEQGWRRVPENIERQLLYLIYMKDLEQVDLQPCWEVLNCPEVKRNRCPAYKFKTGSSCWLINGTICQGTPHSSWTEKLQNCRKCPVFNPVIALLKQKYNIDAP